MDVRLVPESDIPVLRVWLGSDAERDVRRLENNRKRKQQQSSSTPASKKPGHAKIGLVARSIQLAREFSLANGAVRLAFRKRGKLPLSRAEVALASAHKRPAPKQIAPRAKSSAKRPRPKRSAGAAGTVCRGHAWY